MRHLVLVPPDPETLVHLRVMGHETPVCGSRAGSCTYVTAYATCPDCKGTP